MVRQVLRNRSSCVAGAAAVACGGGFGGKDPGGDDIILLFGESTEEAAVPVTGVDGVDIMSGAKNRFCGLY
jgi:hypothetical protein